MVDCSFTRLNMKSTINIYSADKIKQCHIPRSMEKFSIDKKICQGQKQNPGVFQDETWRKVRYKHTLHAISWRNVEFFFFFCFFFFFFCYFFDSLGENFL